MSTTQIRKNSSRHPTQAGLQFGHAILRAAMLNVTPSLVQAFFDSSGPSPSPQMLSYLGSGITRPGPV